MRRQENLLRFGYHESEPNRQETCSAYHFAMTDNSLNLHAIADRFDATWRSERRPSLSSYLDDVEDSQRMRLLELLLPIEIEYRKNDSEVVAAEDYSDLGSEEYLLAQRVLAKLAKHETCLLYTSPSPRDQRGSRMPSSA